MKLLISDISALSLWDHGIGARARVADIHDLEGFRVDADVMRAIEPERFGIARPGDLLVSGGEVRPWSSAWHGHFWNQPLPQESVYQIDDGVYIASPELAFVRLARRLGYIDAIKLGVELCGRYSTLVPPGEDYLKRPPLTNAEKLVAYVETLYSRSQYGVAHRAARFAADNVESPMECATRILLCLKYRHGCPGFPMPEMNHVIELEGEERRLLRKSSLRCDAYWERPAVAVEYKGSVHEGESSLRKDTARENILLSRGITVVPATYASLSTDAGFACLCEALAKALGKRLRFPAGYLERLHQTRSIVLRGNICTWVR
ncbi:MAG: hypothetical protein Q4D27_03055 [Coriobacteriia bacterium]|nr:hypothetical protein [Coriobacteriia bacterium]